MLTLNAEIRRKETEIYDSPCVVEKVIELSPADFDKFKRDLNVQHSFIEENMDLMRVDRDNIWHCLLVMGEGCDDGVLVESEGFGYARYTAHVPGAAALIAQEKQVFGYNALKEFCAQMTQAVETVVRAGMSENTDGCWYVESETLLKLTGIDIRQDDTRNLFFDMLNERSEVVNWFYNEDLSGIGLDFAPELISGQGPEQTSGMGLRL